MQVYCFLVHICTFTVRLSQGFELCLAEPYAPRTPSTPAICRADPGLCMRRRVPLIPSAAG